MSESTKPRMGTVSWMDLTVPDATRVADFYRRVAGWEVKPISMGEYEDYAMVPPGAERAAGGICHARGENAGLPPVWLAYVTVADLDASLTAVRAGGGEVVSGPRSLGSYGRMAVIRDPAGASLALIEQP